MAARFQTDLRKLLLGTTALVSLFATQAQAAFDDCLAVCGNNVACDTACTYEDGFGHKIATTCRANGNACMSAPEGFIPTNDPEPVMPNGGSYGVPDCDNFAPGSRSQCNGGNTGGTPNQAPPASSMTKGVCYWGHLEGLGWRWGCNGWWVGTSGENRRLEALQIWPMTPGLSICYQGHVQNQGDTPIVCNGGTIGTVGQSLRLEAAAVWVASSPVSYPNMKIWYNGWVQDIGFMGGGNGSWVGTKSQSRRLEGFRITMANR